MEFIISKVFLISFVILGGSCGSLPGAANLNNFASQNPSGKKIQVEVDTWEQCIDKPHLPVMFQDIEVRILPDTGDFVFNGVINFTETVHAPWKIRVKGRISFKQAREVVPESYTDHGLTAIDTFSLTKAAGLMTVSVNKCLSNVNMNTCTPFFSTEVKDVCSKLPQENQLWTKFIKDIKMKRNCPVGPEVYRIVDMGSEPSDLKFFPLDNSFYTVTVTGFSKGKEIYCMYVTFQTKLA